MLVYIAMLQRSKDFEKIIQKFETFDRKFEKVFGMKIEKKNLKVEFIFFLIISIVVYLMLFITFCRVTGIFTAILIMIQYPSYTIVFIYINFLISNVFVRIQQIYKATKTLIVREEIVEFLYESLVEIYKFIQEKFCVVILLCLGEFKNEI
jgi:cellulose synthase/poly-beta-1,6-N-acetylglucosamine synthase-like glycosyltransferase